MPLYRRRRRLRATENPETGRSSTVWEVPPDEGHHDRTTEQHELRPSIRSRLLRDRIERIEALPLDPYLQAVGAFALAAGDEALKVFLTQLKSDDGPEHADWREFARLASSTERYEPTLSSAGWAYTTRAIEVTWARQYDDVLKLVLAALPPKSEPERQIVAYGPIATAANGQRDETQRFQKTVLRCIYDAACQTAPSDRAVREALPLWLIAWSDGWAAFGQLAGQYIADAPRTVEQLAHGR